MNRRSGLKIRCAHQTRWAENDPHIRHYIYMYTHWQNISKTTGDIHVLHYHSTHTQQCDEMNVAVADENERQNSNKKKKLSWHEIRCRYCGCHTIIIYTCMLLLLFRREGERKCPLHPFLFLLLPIWIVDSVRDDCI